MLRPVGDLDDQNNSSSSKKKKPHAMLSICFAQWATKRLEPHYLSPNKQKKLHAMLSVCFA